MKIWIWSDAARREIIRRIGSWWNVTKAPLQPGLFNSGDREVARDAAQTAFIRAYQALPRFRAESGFYTWLYKIAVNVCLNAAQKEKRRRDSTSLDTLLESGRFSSEHLWEFRTPAGDFERLQLQETIQKTLNQLSADHRLVVVLKDIEGMSQEEISETLELFGRYGQISSLSGPGTSQGSSTARIQRVERGDIAMKDSEVKALLPAYLESNLPAEQMRELRRASPPQPHVGKNWIISSAYNACLPPDPESAPPGLWRHIARHIVVEDVAEPWKQFEWVGKRFLPILAAAILLLAVLGNLTTEAPAFTLEDYLKVQWAETDVGMLSQGELSRDDILYILQTR